MPDLAYPAGISPGLNVSHIGAQAGQVTFSGVARGGNFIDLTTGKAATISGTPTHVGGFLGPTVNNASNGDIYTFGGKPTVIFNTFTMAGILIPTSFATTNHIFFSDNSSSSSGNFFGADTSAFLKYTQGNSSASVTLSPVLVANIPYFIVFSCFNNLSTSTLNVLYQRLDTGQVFTATAAGATTTGTASNGSYNVGNLTTGVQRPATAFIAALMYSPNTFLTFPELRSWATAPWDFWYPK